MNQPPVDRIELLHAINEWCAGRFSPLIAFPPKTGFPNVVYLYDSNSREMLNDSELLMGRLQERIGRPVMAFTEPLENAPTTALTYRQWIEAGSIMKAIVLTSGEPVYVLPVYNDNKDIIRYVSSEQSYSPDALKVIEQT